MRKLSAILAAFIALTSAAMAGTEYSGKDMKQTAVQTPPECYYGDTEFNVSLWGTYAFTGTESNGVGAPDFFFGENHGDRYLETDHAWGGGGDIKYFFHRYFGIGVEGFVLNAHRGAGFDLESNGVDVFIHERRSENRAVGEVLGTFTFRYPIPCSRFAPYVWAGGGVIWGGGERDEIILDGFGGTGEVPVPLYHTVHHGTTTEPVGQFGGGLEFRITPHIGWTNDFSWNVINGPHNDLGMVRTGLTFAF